MRYLLFEPVHNFRGQQVPPLLWRIFPKLLVGDRLCTNLHTVFRACLSILNVYAERFQQFASLSLAFWCLAVATKDFFQRFNFGFGRCFGFRSVNISSGEIRVVFLSHRLLALPAGLFPLPPPARRRPRYLSAPLCSAPVDACAPADSAAAIEGSRKKKMMPVTVTPAK